MLAAIFIFYAFAVIAYATYKIALKGEYGYIILFACLYLPFYTTILSLSYQLTGSPVVVSFFKYAKDLLMFFALASFILFRRNFASWSFKLTSVDYLMLLFLGMSLVYAFLPLGEAQLIEKLIYYKGIFALGLMYFFGRNFNAEWVKTKSILKVIFALALLAFVFNVAEYLQGTHFQSHTGYAAYNEDINGVEPTGSYFLTWTFETETGQKRFASFFSNPLELASAALIFFPAVLIMLINVPHVTNRIKYLLILFCTISSLWMSFSRASFMALFIEIIFIAVIFRMFRLILFGAALASLSVVYFVFWAPKDVQDFVYDTVTFRNASSLGHAVEWFEGIQSMASAPMGIGLAMSGNAGSVDDSNKVGGENQFIIFGVQLGVLGLLLYIMLLGYSIFYALKAYWVSTSAEASVIPFIAASVKFGLLLPLMTANAELYLFVSLVSWWMIGYSVSLFDHSRSQPNVVDHG